MATSAVEVDAIPSVKHASPSVKVDASPLTFNEIASLPGNKLDFILKTLTAADYISIFFLFLDVKLKKEDFLFLVRQDSYILRNKFLNIYYDFCFKDALLIEIFGTLQKYDLLKYFGTCCHTFGKDKETFTQLNSLWKFLYAVCDQLTDSEVDYLREHLFPENTNMNVYCAEELICLAFLKDKLDEKNWKSKLENIFKFPHPDCSKFIASYKGSNLNYYPLRRPTKTAHCGIAVIINHVRFDGKFQDRPESILDARALKKLWESFGFKTEIHTDLTSEQVNQVFVKLSKDDHSNYDAFVACYLSHGDEGIVISKDGKSIRLTDLVDLIANACETLVGKPKLFFVQACQGRNIQTGFGGQTVIQETIRPNFQATPNCWTPNTEVPTSRHSKNVALRSDVLLFNSSIEGFVSFRQDGSSWFIADLVSNMEMYGEELPVTNILTKVNADVTKREGAIKDTNITKCKQTPVYYNTLKYELKLKKVL